MGKLVDLAGKRFGRWTVVGRSEERRDTRRTWKCLCDCGTVGYILAYSLVGGTSRGCHPCSYKNLSARTRTVAGQMRRDHSREWNSWYGMIQRCTNPKWPKYHLWGGRGIHVSDGLLAFSDFYAVLGDRPCDTTLDRIDTNGHYAPENVRWAPILTQNNNSRFNRCVTIGARTMTVAQWVRELNLTRHQFMWRLDHGQLQ